MSRAFAPLAQPQCLVHHLGYGRSTHHGPPCADRRRSRDRGRSRCGVARRLSGCDPGTRARTHDRAPRYALVAPGDRTRLASRRARVRRIDRRLRDLRAQSRAVAALPGRNLRAVSGARISGARLRPPPVPGRAARPVGSQLPVDCSSGRSPTMRAPSGSTRSSAVRSCGARRNASAPRRGTGSPSASAEVPPRPLARFRCGNHRIYPEIVAVAGTLCASYTSSNSRGRSYSMRLEAIAIGTNPAARRQRRDRGADRRRTDQVRDGQGSRRPGGRPLPLHGDALSGELRLHPAHAVGRRRPVRRDRRQHARHRARRRS